MKKFIYILILIFIFNCKQSEHLEIIEKHDNGLKKIVHKYIISNDKKKVIEKIEYNEEGQKISIKNLLKNTEMEFGYYKNGRKKYIENYKNEKAHGEWIWWHKNGKKKHENEYRNGKHHGKWFERDEKGNIIGKGSFKDGTGEFKGWYASGKKRGEISLKNCSGKEVEWYENGNNKSEFRYIDCALNDKFIKWYKNGNVKQEGEYINDEADGKWTSWYENGIKKNVLNFKDGTWEGKYIKWYKNGKRKTEGEYINGKEHGKFISWYKNGKKKKETTFRNGSLHGKDISWFDNGQKKSEGKFANGSGVIVEWFKNGNKKVIASLKENEVHGKFISYYDNGEKMAETEFKNGKEDGIRVIWYKDGKKRSEVRFEEGKKQGKSIYWNEKGGMSDIVYWENGKYIKGDFGLDIKKYREKKEFVGKIEKHDNEYQKEISASDKQKKHHGFIKFELIDLDKNEVIATKEMLIKKMYIQERPFLKIMQKKPDEIFFEDHYFKVHDDFIIGYGMYGIKEVNSSCGFGITLDRQKTQTFSWEWYEKIDENLYKKLQGAGILEVEYSKRDGYWIISKMKFLGDHILRSQYRGGPIGKRNWHCIIKDGSYIVW